MTFNIDLPVSEKRFAPTKTVGNDLDPGNEIILLVADDSRIVAVGQKLLEKLGYKVETADSGSMAIAIYHPERAAIDLGALSRECREVPDEWALPEAGGGSGSRRRY